MTCETSVWQNDDDNWKTNGSAVQMRYLHYSGCPIERTIDCSGRHFQADEVEGVQRTALVECVCAGEGSVSKQR